MTMEIQTRNKKRKGVKKKEEKEEKDDVGNTELAMKKDKAVEKEKDKKRGKMMMEIQNQKKISSREEDR